MVAPNPDHGVFTQLVTAARNLVQMADWEEPPLKPYLVDALRAGLKEIDEAHDPDDPMWQHHLEYEERLRHRREAQNDS